MVDQAGTDASQAWLTRDRDTGRDAAEQVRLDHLLAQIREKVLAGAHLRPGQHILDLGASTGLLTTTAAHHVTPGGSTTALDKSATALAAIPAPGAAVLYRVTGDAHHIPLADHTIDAVLTRSVLIYLQDLRLVLREIARVLRPGGRLSVFEPINHRRRHDANLNAMTAQELAAIDALRDRSSSVAPAMMAFTEGRLIAAATAAGMSVTTHHTETITDHLGSHDAVAAYLRRRPHPGAPTPIEQVSANLSPAVAARYRAAWHYALNDAADRGITFTTPTLYLTAVFTPGGTATAPTSNPPTQGGTS